MITTEDLRHLDGDTDGLLTYEFIANNIDELSEDDLLTLCEIIKKVNYNGQFCASAARFLSAVSPVMFKKPIDILVEAVIEKDREHKYIQDLMCGIYGHDYAEKSDLLMADDNFRRLYKRLHPRNDSL